MDQQEHPYEHLWAGDPKPAPGSEPRPARRKVPRAAVAAGLTAFFALAGAGVAFAVTGSGSSSPSAPSSPSASTPGPTPDDGPLEGMGHGRHLGFAGGLPGMGGLGGTVVHGQATVKSGSAYKTIDFQIGTVKSVSATSITVVSSDGFPKTYAVQTGTVVDSKAGGISAVKDQDQVVITALDGATPTATNIIDITQVRSSRQGFGFGGFGRGGPPTPTPSSNA